jgi:hypothetical protein
MASAGLLGAKRSPVPMMLALLLGVALLAYSITPHMRAVSLEEEGEEGKDAAEDAEEEEEKTLSHPHYGTRWIRPGANVYQPREDDVANPGYDIPQMQHIGTINPYTEMPYTSQRGLPLIESRYHKQFGYTRPVPPGQKPVFSPHMAQTDLDIMKEFGLMSDSRYKQRESVIQGSNGDAFDSVVRKHSNGVQPPAGWSGASKMCRDVKTHVQGLNKDGWASLNTLKCCSYLCEHTQWSALKQGQLVWGFGARNRYSSAVNSGSKVKLADGTEMNLCRTCAWDAEPTWDETGLDKLPKMEGHLCVGEHCEEGKAGEVEKNAGEDAEAER